MSIHFKTKQVELDMLLDILEEQEENIYLSSEQEQEFIQDFIPKDLSDLYNDE